MSPQGSPHPLFCCGRPPVRSVKCLLPPDASVKPTAEINSSDFVAPWENRWKIAAITPISVPRPRPMYIYPIWATEENAIILRISFSPIALTEPKIIPHRPKANRMFRIWLPAICSKPITR